MDLKVSLASLHKKVVAVSKKNDQLTGVVTFVYPNGSFLLWFEAQKKSVRVDISSIPRGMTVEQGELLDCHLEDGELICAKANASRASGQRIGVAQEKASSSFRVHSLH